jgi:hypothetical protein
VKVCALQTVTIGPGTVLALSERQAARRASLLQPEGDGRWRTLAAVQFKAGEEFGAEVDLPKALAAVVKTDAPVATRRTKSDKVRRGTSRAAPAEAPDAAPAVPPAPTLVDPAQLDIG